jgi:hypothetical protein
MSEATAKNCEIKVITWYLNKRTSIKYILNSNTTIQEIIDHLELKNVCMALLGKNDYPFELMPCDWSDYKDDCKANDFTVNVGDLLMSSPHNIPNIEQFLNNYKIEDLTEEERLKLKEEIKEKFCYNKDFCNGHSIHLFLYNHKENDLCTVSEGDSTEDYNEWAKKDWKLTTKESSLWLQLEKEFLTKEMKEDYDWTEATINDTEATINDKIK